MQVKFLDLTPTPELREQLDDAHARVMSSGRYIGGEEVEAFEEEWARYIGAKYCVSCGNGFDALVLAMKAHGVGSRCKVAVPTFTCLPTWAAIEATGAMVKPVDALNELYNHDVSAIVPVHLYGNLYPIKEASVPIIEDACQAHGTCYSDGTKVGSKNTTAWSFYPTKNLGCYGDGGAVTTNDPLVAACIRELRNYGGDISFVNGINSRLDSLQAAYLRVKLKHLDEENRWRRERAMSYAYHCGLYASTELSTTTNWHQFVVASPRRDELKSFLYANGVETMIHYKNPPHRHARFSAYKDSCPNADLWSETALSIPIGSHLTREQVEYIISKINEWIETCQ